MSSLWTGNRVHGVKALTTNTTVYDKTLITATIVYNLTTLLMVPIKHIDMYSIASNKYETYSKPISFFDIRHSKQLLRERAVFFGPVICAYVTIFLASMRRVRYCILNMISLKVLFSPSDAWVG